MCRKEQHCKEEWSQLALSRSVSRAFINTATNISEPRIPEKLPKIPAYLCMAIPDLRLSFTRIYPTRRSFYLSIFCVDFVVKKVAMAHNFVVKKVAMGHNFVVKKVAMGHNFVVKKVAMGHNFFAEYFNLPIPVIIPPKIRINSHTDAKCDHLTLLYQRAQSYTTPKIKKKKHLCVHVKQGMYWPVNFSLCSP